jgi:hypothetical protein
LNYADIVVALGDKEDDRKEYLEITNMVSMDEQIPEDERSEKRSANLASYIIKKSMEKMGTVRDSLNKAA